jgi:hypothetical protein
MANAVKTIARYIKRNEDKEAAVVLRELCQALEASGSFELSRLYELNNKAFRLALELLEEWRFDRHVIERRLQKYLDQDDRDDKEAV